MPPKGKDSRKPAKKKAKVSKPAGMPSMGKVAKTVPTRVSVKEKDPLAKPDKVKLTADVDSFIAGLGLKGAKPEKSKKKLTKAERSKADKEMAKKDNKTKKLSAQEKTEFGNAEKRSMPDAVFDKSRTNGKSGSGAKNLFATDKDDVITWYKVLKAPKVDASSGGYADAQTLFTKAAKLYNGEVAHHEHLNRRNQQTRMMEQMLTAGTFSDKIAAMTLAVQASPLHNLRHLSALTRLAQKNHARESASALEALKDLYITNIMPDRKLKYFVDQPLGAVEATGGENRDRYLALFYFEDQLKAFFADFVHSLDGALKNTAVHYKRSAMVTCADLLAAKPEQEAQILSLLVNKLGDPDRVMAAKATFLLQQVVRKHPAMKSVVCHEVQRLLRRPNVAERTVYYGVLFLNQFYLTEKDTVLAGKLVDIYFVMFEQLTARGDGDDKDALTQDGLGKADAQQKLLGALLTGVNRAFPYSKASADQLASQTATLFRAVHQAPFNTAVQALLLLQQVMGASSAELSSRYYNALYHMLQSPTLYVQSLPPPAVRPVPLSNGISF
jgi:ribosome biogenesis protein MAK21